MSIEGTLLEEIEHVREKLNEAAAQNLSSTECFRLSLELDALLERYIEGTFPNQAREDTAQAAAKG